MLDDVVKELEPAAMLTHGPTDFHSDHVAMYQRLPADAAPAHVRLLLLPADHAAARCRCRSSRAPTSTSPTPSTARCTAIAAHESQFYSRGIAYEMYRDFARINGRMVGVEYAEGLDISRIIFS